MKNEAIYVYGMTRGSIAVDDVAAIEDGCGVERIDCGEIVVVASRVSLEEYQVAFESTESADPAWVIPRALRHEQVVETIAARATILPARFGTLFSSVDSMTDMIQSHEKTIHVFLDEIEGKDEWSFKIDFDIDATTEHVLTHEPDFVHRYEALPASPGARFFKEKTLRAEARIAARRAMLATTKRIYDHLGAHADCRQLPLRRLDVPGRERLLNLAALLPRDQAREVIERLHTVAGEEDIPVEVGVTGPWPPFSFCPSLG